MYKPLKEIYITQHFGANPIMYKQFGLPGHPGVDFKAAIGTDVFASISGKIKVVVHQNGYGKHIYIKNSKFEIVLGHLDSFSCKNNQTIKEGDIVGRSGNTGYSTGPHLHFGVREVGLLGIIKNKNNGYNGWLDPLLILDDFEQYVGLYERIFKLFRLKHQSDSSALAFCPEKGGQLWLIKKCQKRSIKGIDKIVEALIAVHAVGVSKKDIDKIPNGNPL